MILPLLYIAQALLVAAALMMLGAAYPRLTGLSFAARSALGLTLTPPVLGLSTLAIALAWPGAPRAAFFLIPIGLAGAGLGAMNRHFVRVFHEGRAAIARWRLLRGEWAVLVGCLAILAFFVAAVASSFGEPTGNDALVYLSEARVFADARTIASIPSFDAVIGQVVKTHPHLFLWQAYLAQGLMATDGPLGRGHDVFARLAMQATFALVPLSTLLVARAATPIRTMWLAPAILLTFGGIEYITRNYSVDGFRIITFLAFIALILPGLGRREPWSIGRVAVIGIVCAIAAAAHTLDIAFVAFTGLACILLALFGFLTWRNVIFTGIACAIFLLPVVAPYARNFLVYGNVLGEGMNYVSYRDTSLWLAFEHERSWTKTENLVTAFFDFALQYRLIPMLVAFACALLSVAVARKYPFIRRPAGLSTIFLVILVLFLLPLGREGGFQGAMLSNERYGLVICALAASVIAANVPLCLRWNVPSAMHNRWPSILFLGTCTLLFAAAAMWVTLLALEAAWFAERYLKNNEAFVADAVERLPPGENWATDRYTPTYFVSRPPVFLYSSLGRPLLRAHDEAAVLAILAKDKIKLVALYNGDADWWPRTEFYRVITHLPGTKVVTRKKWRLFELPPFKSGDHPADGSPKSKH